MNTTIPISPECKKFHVGGHMTPNIFHTNGPSVAHLFFHFFDLFEQVFLHFGRASWGYFYKWIKRMAVAGVRPLIAHR